MGGSIPSLPTPTSETRSHIHLTYKVRHSESLFERGLSGVDSVRFRPCPLRLPRQDPTFILPTKYVIRNRSSGVGFVSPLGSIPSLPIPISGVIPLNHLIYIVCYSESLFERGLSGVDSVRFRPCPFRLPRQDPTFISPTMYFIRNRSSRVGCVRILGSIPSLPTPTSETRSHIHLTYKVRHSESLFERGLSRVDSVRFCPCPLRLPRQCRTFISLNNVRHSESLFERGLSGVDSVRFRPCPLQLPRHYPTYISPTMYVIRNRSSGVGFVSPLGSIPSLPTPTTETRSHIHLTYNVVIRNRSSGVGFVSILGSIPSLPIMVLAFHAETMPRCSSLSEVGEANLSHVQPVIRYSPERGTGPEKRGTAPGKVRGPRTVPFFHIVHFWESVIPGKNYLMSLVSLSIGTISLLNLVEPISISLSSITEKLPSQSTATVLSE